MAGSLTVRDREAIFGQLVRDRGVRWVVVAGVVGVHPTTVAREVARNGGREGYSPSVAQTRCEEKRRRPRPPKLADPVLGGRVARELEAGFSPMGVAKILAREGISVSHETIYRAVYEGVIAVDPRQCLRTRRRVRRGRKKDLTTNPTGNYLGDYRPICDRPAHIGQRVEVGHWEGDLIAGVWARTHMITLYERTCRLTHLIALPDGKASRLVVAALGDWFETLPQQWRLSLTWDQGSEMARWAQIDDLFQLGVYFADKRSPWQRGGNENNNRLIRFWFPRTQSVTDPDGQRIPAALNILNNQPRRSLNWQTPNEIYNHHTVQ
jgi:IS30 family transposase